MKFTITKKNGTVLTKDVGLGDDKYIKKLKNIGWKEVVASKPTPKPKPKAKVFSKKKK
jgi:hypothetical protein